MPEITSQQGAAASFFQVGGAHTWEVPSPLSCVPTQSRVGWERGGFPKAQGRTPQVCLKARGSSSPPAMALPAPPSLQGTSRPSSPCHPARGSEDNLAWKTEGRIATRTLGSSAPARPVPTGPCLEQAERPQAQAGWPGPSSPGRPELRSGHMLSLSPSPVFPSAKWPRRHCKALHTPGMGPDLTRAGLGGAGPPQPKPRKQ